MITAQHTISVAITEKGEAGELTAGGGLSAQLLFPYNNVLNITDTTIPVNYTIAIPVGFMTDFVSVPAVVQWIVPKIGYGFTEAAVVHDYLYQTPIAAISRKMADETFMRLALQNGASRVRVTLAYWGLRLFGSRAWDNYRARKV